KFSLLDLNASMHSIVMPPSSPMNVDKSTLPDPDSTQEQKQDLEQKQEMELNVDMNLSNDTTREAILEEDHVEYHINRLIDRSFDAMEWENFIPLSSVIPKYFKGVVNSRLFVTENFAYTQSPKPAE